MSCLVDCTQLNEYSLSLLMWVLWTHACYPLSPLFVDCSNLKPGHLEAFWPAQHIFSAYWTGVFKVNTNAFEGKKNERGTSTSQVPIRCQPWLNWPLWLSPFLGTVVIRDSSANLSLLTFKYGEVLQDQRVLPVLQTEVLCNCVEDFHLVPQLSLCVDVGHP